MSPMQGVSPSTWAGVQAPGTGTLLPPGVPGQVCRPLEPALCCPLVFISFH